MKHRIMSASAQSKHRATKAVGVKAPRRGAARPPSRRVYSAAPMRGISLEFADVFAASPTKAQRLVYERLALGTRTDMERVADAGELVQWAAAPERGNQRRTLIAAFAQSKAEIVLIHKLCELPKEQIDTFIKEYFQAGGSLAPVARWLQLAGRAMRQKRMGMRARGQRVARAIPHRGFNPFKPIGDLFEKGGDLITKGVDAIGNAVDSLADAVTKAGKSLGQMVNEAASWTVSELTDLVDALVRAGKKVGDILAAAAAKSIDQLKKYVEALLDAGRSVGELMAWAVGQALSSANAVVAKLIALGRSVLDIVKSVLNLGRNALVAALRGVIAAGKTVANVLAAFAGEALSAVQSMIDALLELGRTLREVLVEAAKLAATACRNIVGALLNLGRTLGQLLLEAANALGTTLRVIADALLALGKSMAQLLAAVASQAASVVKALVSALFALGKKLADIVAQAVSQTPAIIKAVLEALVSLGYKVVDILVTVAERTLNAKMLVLEALLRMGYGLGVLAVDICTGIAEAFRKGFFEGLLALGKTPLQILQAVFEVKASIVFLAFGVLLELFGGYRPLTRAERREAEIIFGSSINLDRVKVGFAKLPYDVIDYVNIEIPRAFTTMYLLNFGPGANVNTSTIIHELTHVWQGVQTGPIYMTRALEAQIGAGVKSLLHTGRYSDRAAYRATAEELVAHNGDFSKFNPEEQAQIVEDFWRATRDGATDTLPVKDLRPYARTVFTPLRTTRARAVLRSARAVKHRAKRILARRPARTLQRAAA